MILSRKNKIFRGPNKILSLCLALFAICSCKYSEEFHLIEKPNHFSMEVPEYIKKLDNLGDYDFQYGNQFRNFYFIVEESPKNAEITSTEMYAQKSLKELMSVPTFSEPDTTEIKPITDLNGLKGRHMIMTATVGGESIKQEILYHLLHLESEEKYYHIALWTWADWEEKYKEVIPKILNSFREI